jgi:hypothetical protein
MGFFGRFAGVVFNPQKTFESLAEKPVWLDALIIVLIAFSIHGFLTAPYYQKDSLHMMENSIKLREKYGEEGYNRMIERLRNPSTVQTLVVGAGTFLIGLLAGCVLLLGFGRMSSTQGKFHQIFAACIHANFVDKILGNSLRLVLVLSRKSVLQTSTGLALLFPRLEVASPAYVILSQIDFFQLWLFGILAFGLAAIFKVGLKKALVISYLVWLLKTLFTIGLGFLALSWMS